MSSKINIGTKDQDDPFYRYHMPPLSIARVGNSTAINNVDHVAAAINADPRYIVKFMAVELGTASSYKKSKGKAAALATLSGAFPAKRLAELLDQFIENFSLCARCKYPETTVALEGKGKSVRVILVCASCGHRRQVDARHKLTKFIATNPPNIKPRTQIELGPRISLRFEDVTKIVQQEEKTRAKSKPASEAVEKSIAVEEVEEIAKSAAATKSKEGKEAEADLSAQSAAPAMKSA